MQQADRTRIHENRKWEKLTIDHAILLCHTVFGGTANSVLNAHQDRHNATDFVLSTSVWTSDNGNQKLPFHFAYRCRDKKYANSGDWSIRTAQVGGYHTELPKILDDNGPQCMAYAYIDPATVEIESIKIIDLAKFRAAYKKDPLKYIKNTVTNSDGSQGVFISDDPFVVKNIKVKGE